ncbi:MAG: histidine phosphatase family protein [Pseudomonadota bacterium]|nr:histidine phosphatase family protein [Pseudomonadota bacterium]
MTNKVEKNGDACTRWWWVRHAPVTINKGRMYGASDPKASIGTPEIYKGLAELLPNQAICVTSSLQRTRQTLKEIRAHGLLAEKAKVEPGLSEQNFGIWQGKPYEQIPSLASPRLHKYWFTTVEHAPPEGESYIDVTVRVTEVIERLTNQYAGRDIIAVAHGGPIRAALGHALNLSPTNCLGFETDNLSVTRLDFEPSSKPGLDWYVRYTNLVPKSF